jgi:hypothetical protein
MTQLLKTLPLVAALIAAPALAAQPDPHAGRHPEATAETAKPAPKPDGKPAMHACPMMHGTMAAGSGAMAGKAPDGKMMMMEGKDMHCMAAPTAAKTAESPQDHDHSAPASKSPEKPK